MNRRSSLSLLSLALATVSFVACGTAGSRDELDLENRADAGPSDNGSSGAPSGSSSGGLTPTPTTDGGDSSCASSAAEGAFAKANLVVMYDKSGSMGDPAATGPNSPYNRRWVPVANAMKEFFDDPGSSGLSASLQFFPEADRAAQNGMLNVEAECAANYATPAVAMTSLPDPTFATTIDATQPFGGTPTRPALAGAVSYARTIQGQRPDDKTVVVLVTDGIPGYVSCNGWGFCSPVPGCSGNTIAAIGQDAQAAHDGHGIATYVIGIADGTDEAASLANLNAVAAKGGTQSAFIVSVSDPASTKAQLTAALDQIRGDSVSCSVTIPPPPDGQQLDVDRVNVAVTQGDQSTELTKSVDCSNPNGWHYDDPAQPTQIELCPEACALAKANNNVQVRFGCATRIN